MEKNSRKVSLQIDGDTITKNHEIDVVMQLSKFYLDLYNIPDEDRKRRIIELNKSLSIASGSVTKAEQYSRHNMTFQDSVPANGALVLYGESPIDREGKPIFEKYDKKLLKL